MRSQGALGSEFVVRAALMYLPLAATVVVWRWRRPDRRWAAGALVASAWNVPALLASNAVSLHMGWTSFGTSGPVLLGMPVDLGLGWALLWGAFPVLAFRRSVVLPVALLLWVDWITMPYAAPVVMLERQWLFGEALTVAVALVPGIVLGRLTQVDRGLRARTAMQLAAFTGLAFGVVPLGVLEATTDSVTSALAGARWWLAPAALPALVVGASAVQEFVRRGAGTPVPFDPPRFLVTSGPYAYVANPMQMSGTLAFLVLAAVLRSWWLLAVAGLAVALSSGLFGWSESGDLRDRFGDAWIDYRRQVRNWIPRWRPVTSHEPARLYVSVTCAQCRATGDVLARLGPRGLRIEAAESCPIGPRTRATYVVSEGSGVQAGVAGRRLGPDPVVAVRSGGPEAGVAALARALEHVHLGWALFSFLVRLPLVCAAVQATADACGFGPRAVPWTPPETQYPERTHQAAAGGSVPIRKTALGDEFVVIAAQKHEVAEDPHTRTPLHHEGQELCRPDPLD